MSELKSCAVEELVVSSGIKHLPIVDEYGHDTGRTISFNPSDPDFMDDLLGLTSKLEKIHKIRTEALEQAEDAAAKFDISRAEDKEMREAVDSLFGEGFCKDVFPTRLVAMAQGLTVVENFLFALLDKMDETIKKNLSDRDARLQKYMAKYRK